MRAFALVAGLMIALVLTGCGRRPAPLPPAPPPAADLSTQDLANVRAEWQKADPTARVGVVGATRSDSGKKWAAVQDINVEGIRQGDLFSLIAVVGGRQETLARATVHHVEGKIVVLEYTPVDGAIRQPEKGDLALIFGKK